MDIQETERSLNDRSARGIQCCFLVAMLRRCWIVILAFGLALAGEAKAQDSTHTPSQGGGNQEDTQGRKAAPREPAFPIRIIDDPVEAERVLSRETDAVDREKQDLAAQESMASSTEQIVRLSIWQLGLAAFGTFVAAIGTGGLLYSLILNRRATDAAIRAAAAARDAVSTERAWMSHASTTPMPQTIDRHNPGNRTHIGFHVEFKNLGRSPARVLSFESNFYLGDTLLDVSRDIFSFPENTPPQLDGVALIGPSQSIFSNRIQVPVGEFPAIFQEEKILLLYATLTYRDLFSEVEHKTTMCLVAAFKRPLETIHADPFNTDIFVFLPFRDWNKGD
ncbi:hypothetical protein [Mesorhizobium sp.]|uniref:hypothetical protein n=1 Tax=Mesorhizobium sp. TaxID=1871066 RepID=UPI000FE66E2E|nr:hypothetical protein [Mesorhizobium sp.]RWQ65052.1 MAG: hypothetical protein EOS86_17295 [Mesorhizobium sp.]